jgi:hypothetical protein
MRETQKTNHQSANPQAASSSQWQPRAFTPDVQTQSEVSQVNPPEHQDGLNTQQQKTGHSFSQINLFSSGTTPPLPPAKPHGLQAKLTIGEPNDKYEQAADLVAQSPPFSENQLADGQISSVLEGEIQRQRGNGQSLDSRTQQSMQTAMGADFSGVKIHTDTQSDQMSRLIQAKAFTTGQDIFFRKGEYAPGSRSGQALIAHELTHVVQQSGAHIKRKETNNLNADQQLSSPLLSNISIGNSTNMPLLQRNYEEDLESLRQIILADPNTTLAKILQEVIQASQDVREWETVDTSGSAVPLDDRSETYKVAYQQGAGAPERLGNLVHELTHVAVDKAYHRDFVNYVIDVAQKQRLTAEEWQAKGYPSEAEYLQGNYYNDPDTTFVLWQKLEDLKTQIPSAGLDEDNAKKVKDKLIYAQARPQAEFDTNINQILVWLHLWEINPGNDFYRAIEETAEEARLRRSTDGVVPLEQAEAPAPSNKCCYITTACMKVRGLPDDCYQLNKLRQFRDGYMRGLGTGLQLIQTYYQHSPAIVEAINQRSNSQAIYTYLYEVIEQCVDAIQQEHYNHSLDTYCQMVMALHAEYTPDRILPRWLLEEEFLTEDAILTSSEDEDES